MEAAVHYVAQPSEYRAAYRSGVVANPSQPIIDRIASSFHTSSNRFPNFFDNVLDRIAKII